MLKYINKVLKDLFLERRHNICYLRYIPKKRLFDFSRDTRLKRFEVEEEPYIYDKVVNLVDRGQVTRFMCCRRDKFWHNRIVGVPYQVTHDNKVIFDYKNLIIKNK